MTTSTTRVMTSSLVDAESPGTRSNRPALRISSDLFAVLQHYLATRSRRCVQTHGARCKACLRSELIQRDHRARTE